MGRTGRLPEDSVRPSESGRHRGAGTGGAGPAGFGSSGFERNGVDRIPESEPHLDALDVLRHLHRQAPSGWVPWPSAGSA